MLDKYRLLTAEVFVKGPEYVEIRVEVPEQLTPEQEAAAKAFAEKAGMKY